MNMNTDDLLLLLHDVVELEGKHASLMAETNRVFGELQALKKPLRERFGLEFKFELYAKELQRVEAQKLKDTPAP